MHKSRLAALVIDCRVDDIGTAAEFWSKALGRPIVQAEEDLEKYARLDVLEEEVHVLIQKVDHPSRVHLDIETDNIAAEVHRLEALGATTVKVLERWTVMETPTGHRFCVVNPQRPDFQNGESVNVSSD